MKCWKPTDGEHDVTTWVGPTTDEIMVTVGSNIFVLVVRIVIETVWRGGVDVMTIVDGGTLTFVVWTTVLKTVNGGSVIVLQTVWLWTTVEMIVDGGRVTLRVWVVVSEKMVVHLVEVNVSVTVLVEYFVTVGGINVKVLLSVKVHLWDSPYPEKAFSEIYYYLSKRINFYFIPIIVNSTRAALQKFSILPRQIHNWNWILPKMQKNAISGLHINRLLY